MQENQQLENLELNNSNTIDKSLVIEDTNKNNQGKRLIVLLLLLTGIIFLSLLVFLNKKNQTNFTNSNDEMNEPILVQEDISLDKISELDTTTKEWQSYTIFNEKFSFNYPQDWELEENNIDNADPEWSVGDVSLLSPNNFLLRIRTNMDGLGGGCDEECQKYNVPNQTLTTLNFYKQPLYVVLNGFQPNEEFRSTGNIRFSVIPVQNCWNNVCYGFEGMNTQGTTMITGEFVSKKNKNISIYMTADEFINSPDIGIAIKILKTLSY